MSQQIVKVHLTGLADPTANQDDELEISGNVYLAFLSLKRKNHAAITGEENIPFISRGIMKSQPQCRQQD